jgi:hypothetical protein
VQHTIDGTTGVDEQRVLVTPETYLRPENPVTVEGAAALRRFLVVEN